MFQTAATINQVFDLCQKEFIFEEVLKKYFSRKSERNEFRQELWLCIFEKDQDEITALWNRKEFKYYYISIVNSWVKSSSSKWHKQFRHKKEMLMEFLPEAIEEEQFQLFIDEDNEEAKEKKRYDAKRILLVQKALTHYEKIDPQFKFEAECFRMYYFQNLSIRQIQKKLQNISTFTIWQGIQYASLMIKFHIHKYTKN